MATKGLGLIESVKKGKIVMKILDIVEWSLWKMMSANVKATMKQQEIKDLATVSYIFFKKYPQNLKYNIKEGVFFIWFSLAFHLFHSWYFPLTTGVGGAGLGVGRVFLNEKNLLSVQKLFVDSP